MNIQLFRIDDRLIHGQVVLGWAAFLHSRRIILCDDLVSENEWEKELYLSIVPSYIESLILTVRQTAELLKNNETDFSKTIILVNSPTVIEQILDLGIQLTKINVGGMHFQDSRKKYLPYLFLNEQEVESFYRIMKRGVQFNCLDVPQGKTVALENILSKKN